MNKKDEPDNSLSPGPNTEVVVQDLMQSGYRYVITEQVGKNFDAQFLPELTPKKMLAMGVFGGKYMTDCKDEFPADWFEHAKLCSEKYDIQLNFFQVRASKPLSYWLDKGWIHEDDPRGWFQWYCRYYVGRRHQDDQRQIGRWKAMKSVSSLCATMALSLATVGNYRWKNWGWKLFSQRFLWRKDCSLRRD